MACVLNPQQPMFMMMMMMVMIVVVVSMIVIAMMMMIMGKKSLKLSPKFVLSVGYPQYLPYKI